jgi:subfamily B ATP-binding cassette protein MsbA
MVALGVLQPMLAALTQPLVDESLIQKDPDALWQIPIMLVLIYSLKGVAEYISSVASQSLAQKVMADIRGCVFSSQIDLPLRRHASEPGGRMLSRVLYDTASVGEAVSSGWVVIIRESLTVLGLLGFLFYTSWQLSLLVILVVPAFALIIRKASNKLRQFNVNLQELVGRMTGLVEEALLSLKEIKIFQAEKQQGHMFNQANHDLRREIIRSVRVQSMNVPLVQTLAAISVGLLIYAASKMVASGLLTPGEFIAYITAASMMFSPLRRLTQVSAVLQRGLAAAQSIFAILDEKGESVDPGASPWAPPAPGATSGLTPAVAPMEPASPTAPPATPATSAPTAMPPSPATSLLGSGALRSRLSGRITMQSISYQYPFQDKPALQNFSLSIEPNEVVALVGPSGAGKSTVLYLLAGFDSPSQGQILFDGEPLQATNLQQLRQNIALVSQRVTLFNETIAQNIEMGRPGASRQAIEEAARAAHAWEFIQKLPEGLDTPLGSLGDRLSGGQRQRIAIARAFLKDAPILLLDEATSALDKESEQAVLQGLQSLIVNRTVILVSHAPERLMPGLRRVDIAFPNR